MIPDQSQPQKNDRKAVAIFGEILADIFPEQSVLGGAPFNVARHLQALGLDAVIISRVGNDALRDELLQEMKRLQMNTSGIQFDPTHPTGQVLVHLENGAHRFEILPNQAYDHIHAGITHMLTMSIKPQLVYFGTLAQRDMTSRLALDEFLSIGKSPRLLDINLRHPWYNKHTIRRSLRRADIVKMNAEELHAVTDCFKIRGASAQIKAQILLEEFDLDMLLVTCGADGAWMINAEQETFHTGPASTTHDLVDTVGAGDAFAAVFILGLLSHWEMPLTLQRANQFAAALCGIRGGAPQHADFYAPFQQQWGL